MALYFESAFPTRCALMQYPGTSVTIRESLGVFDYAGNIYELPSAEFSENLKEGDTLTVCRVWSLNAGYTRIGVYSSKESAQAAYDKVIADLKASGEHTFIAAPDEDSIRKAGEI